MVSRSGAPFATCGLANDFATDGASNCTMTDADAGALFAPADDVTLPAAIVFVYVPVTFDSTSTEIVHDAPPVIVPPLSVSELAPPVAVKVPPHVVLAFGVDAFFRFVGYASVSATDVIAAAGFGLVIVIVIRSAVPIVVAGIANDFATTGFGATTVSVATAAVLFVTG